MGAATAEILVELGAEVHAVDIKTPDLKGLASYTQCDLRDPEQIAATAARIGHVVNALFNCAGLPNTFSELDVMLVNFCGLRALTEAVIPLMVEGAAVASIASTAGIGWMQNMKLLSELLARRLTGEPLAWITGSVTFCGLTLRIDPGVYVPRWHTELLARRAVKRLPQDGTAIDLCTGAGAIAATLVAHRPEARVLATEVDPWAVACARAA